MEEEFYIEDDAALLRPPHEQTRKARARGLPLAALLLVASALVFVKNGVLRQDDAIELHSEGASLSFAACAQYDDDAFYPADPITGAACFSQDVARRRRRAATPGTRRRRPRAPWSGRPE